MPITDKDITSIIEENLFSKYELTDVVKECDFSLSSLVILNKMFLFFRDQIISYREKHVEDPEIALLFRLVFNTLELEEHKANVERGIQECTSLVQRFRTLKIETEHDDDPPYWVFCEAFDIIFLLIAESGVEYRKDWFSTDTHRNDVHIREIAYRLLFNLFYELLLPISGDDLFRVALFRDSFIGLKPNPFSEPDCIMLYEIDDLAGEMISQYAPESLMDAAGPAVAAPAVLITQEEILLLSERIEQIRRALAAAGRFDDAIELDGKTLIYFGVPPMHFMQVFIDELMRYINKFKDVLEPEGPALEAVRGCRM